MTRDEIALNVAREYVRSNLSVSLVEKELNKMGEADRKATVNSISKAIAIERLYNRG